MKSKLIFILAIAILFCGCSKNSISKEKNSSKDIKNEYNSESKTISESEEISEPQWNAIADGDTLETRINEPLDFERIEVSEGSFGDFLRKYEMKPDGSQVLIYDGTPKGNQNDHVAVFARPIEDRDLQQCADSIMRMYGEYYYSKGQYDKIKFPMGGGFVGDFSKWSQGYSISLSGNSLCWIRSSSCDSSYDSFVKFMNLVFAMNMEDASKGITIEEAQIGDVFIKGGSPGHVVMIVDMCENEAGEKAFLLGQGYMPAQEFHVIKNPLHPDDPWYYETELTYPFITAEYTFPENSLKRFMK